MKKAIRPQATTILNMRSLVAIATIFITVILITVTGYTQDTKNNPNAEAKPKTAAPAPSKEQSDRQQGTTTGELNLQQASTLDGINESRPAPEPQLVTGTTYPATFQTGVALEDMSTGTTTLVAAGLDDNASSLTNIGFDFWYDGVRYTQFSVNANGLCRLGSTVIDTSFTNSLASTTDAPKIAPYWDDLWIGTNGKVHFKVVGSAPNRKLVAEWQNMTIPRQSAATTGAGTFQMWLFETTGVIEFVYGSGIVVNSANSGYSVGLQSGAATNFASITTTSVPSVSYTTANNTQTNAIASGTAYLFTPNVPAAPTNLTFTNVTATTMTLNWTDNATNEVGYVLYVSTDNVTFAFLGQFAANTTSVVISGATPSTTYFWKVYAVTEGALSAALTGSQATTAGKVWNGAGVSGGTGGTDFNAGANWVGGVAPGSSDEAVITTTTAATITLSADITIGALTVLNNATGAVTLALDATTKVLTVNGNLTGNINAAGGSSTILSFRVGNSPGNITVGGTATFGNNTNSSSFIGFTGSAGGTTTGTIKLKGNAAFGVTYGTLGGTFGSLIFDGTGTQTISTNNSFNIGINAPVGIGSTNTPTVVVSSTFTGNMALSNAADGLTVSTGSTLDLTSRTWNKSTAGGTFSLGAGSTLKLGGTTGGQTGSNFPLSYTTLSLNATSTVDYNATSAQTIFAAVTYGNLTLTGAAIKTAGAALTMLGNLTINAGATFAAGTSLTHNVGGNWANNGTFSFTTTSIINFNTAGSKTVSGSSVTAFNNLTVNKGTDNTNVLDVTAPITVSSLTLTNGTFKWSNSGTVGLSTGSLTVGATTGLWVNGGTVNVGTSGGSLNLTGLLRASAGTLNVGSATGNSIVYSTGSTITVDGGNVNVTGRINRNLVSSTTTYTQSSGTVTVVTIGSASGSDAGFDIGAVASSFTMGGGSIVIQRATSNASDYLNLAATNNVTGGTLQIGNASTLASQVIRINSTAPVFNLTINSTNSPTGQLVTNSLTVKNTVTLSGGTLDANNLNMTVGGDWTNNGGTFTPGTGTVTFNNTTATQSINGTVASQTFNNVTVSKTGQTLNVGGSTTALTVGNALTVSAGTFDQGASANLTSGPITVSVGATFQNLGTGDLTLSSNVSNSGTMIINANGNTCGDADSILIRSSDNVTQRAWSGTGTFTIKDVDVKDQGGTAIIVVNSGTDSGNNGANWRFVPNCTGGSYVWTGTTGTDWNVATNWSPSRVPDLVGGGDVITIDGTTTPSPLITNVPTQTIAILRLINNAAPMLQTTGTNTLTISGGTGSDLTVPSGSQLTLSGSGSALTISVAAGSQGIIGGLVLFQDGTHSLIGNAANAITFQSGAIATTAPGTYNDNPFGTGASGDGTAGSVIFANGSNYFHNAGQSPFGAAGNASVAVFQTGSTANWLTTSGFQASNRTYADLNVGKTDPSGVTVAVSDSGTGNFQFDNLQLVRNSSLTYNGSGASMITIQGNINSDGTGSPVNDLSLTAGTGGIVMNKPGLQTFAANAAAKTITFGSNATVNSGTTLALANRNLIMSPSTNAGPVLSINGALSAGATGYVIGKLKKFYTGVGTNTYEVGTANGYSPVSVTANAGSGDVTAIAFQTPQPRMGNTAKALQRYWTLTDNGITNANLTFNYLDIDVPGTANENNFVIFKVDGNTVTMPGGSVNTGMNMATINGVTSFSDWTLGEPNAPTLVKLRGFNATRDHEDVMIRWQSGYEVDNLGYNLYREQNGQRTRVTRSMIAGSALLAGQRTVLTAGQPHTWFDRLPAGSARVSYWLEDVDVNGKRTLHGPITPVTGKVDRHQSAQAQTVLLDQLSAATASGQQAWPTAWNKQRARLNKIGFGGGTVPDRQHDVAGLPGVKIMVRQQGWVRVSQPELVAAGLDPNVAAPYLQLYAEGREVPIIVSASVTAKQFTANDWLEFYGQGLDTPTANAQTYYLVVGTSDGKRIARIPAQGTGQSGAQNFSYIVERKERSIYFSGLDNGDAENFFGQVITTTAVSSPLSVQHLDATASSVQLRVTLQGVTAGSHQVNVQVNGADVGTINFADREHPTKTFNLSPAMLHEGDNNVQMVAANGETDVSLVDTLQLTYAHTYTADNNRLQFSIRGGATVNINGFSGSNIRIVDITDPYAIQELVPTVTSSNGSYTATVQIAAVKSQNVKTLMAFVDNEVDHPALLTKNEPSSLSSNTNGADFLIITQRAFRDSVQPLAELRRSQGLQVSVVDVEDVYDEFSYGAHSPQAIRDFITRAAQSWPHAPHYVLLVGDATYDPRNYLGQGDNDLVPTKMLYAGTMETASDDWLADFNADGVPELAMGRLPVRTSQEATTMISKITGYSPSSAGQGVLLIADRNDDQNNFEGASQNVQSRLPSGTPVEVINRGNQETGAVHSQIITGINAGPLVVNYYGHGSVGLWTGSGLLNTGDAGQLTNGTRLPLFTIMTCLNGFFQDVNGESMSEALLKAPQGGAIAVWASSGLTETNRQAEMDQQLYGTIFGTQSVALGDAVRAAKTAAQDQSVRRTWIFFGDPTMRLR